MIVLVAGKLQINRGLILRFAKQTLPAGIKYYNLLSLTERRCLKTSSGFANNKTFKTVADSTVSKM